MSYERYVKGNNFRFEVRHAPLNLQRRVLGLCSNYVRNHNICTHLQCPKLHICRAWLGGHCANSQCELSHELFNDPHNARVLQQRKIPRLGCPENVREEILKTLPQICMYYNLGRCKFSDRDCDNLHICKELAMTGRCLAAQCLLNHDFKKSDVLEVLRRYGIDIPEIVRDYRVFFADVVCPDDKKYASVCTCGAASSYQPPASGGSPSFLAKPKPRPRLDYEEDEEDEDEDDDEEYVELKYQPKSFGNRTSRFDGNGAVGSGKPGLVAYLLEHDCYATAEQVRRDFNLDASANLRDWLTYQRSLSRAWLGGDTKFIFFVSGKVPIDFFCLFRFFRLCHYYNFEHCIASKCDCLHICRSYVAGLCQSSKSCGLSHDVDACKVFHRFGIDHWPKERKLRLILASHPRICTAYVNFNDCSMRQNCSYFHMCNEYVMIDRRPDSFVCEGEGCPLFHGYFHPQNQRILAHFGLESAPMAIIRRLTIPASNRSPTVSQSQFAAAAPPSLMSLKVDCVFPIRSALFEPSADRNANASPGPQPQLNELSYPARRESPPSTLPKETPPVFHNPFVTAVFNIPLSTTEVAKRFALCESYLRRECHKDDACDKFHYDSPFCWAYEVSEADSTAETGVFEYDGSRWVAFSKADNQSIEDAYCDPSERVWSRVINLRENYPFGGRSEMVFSNQRARETIDLEVSSENNDQLDEHLVTHTLQSRLKKRDGQTGSASFSSPIGIRVVCIRTASVVACNSTQANASMRYTNWVWYMLDNESGNWLRLANKFGLEGGRMVEKSFVEGRADCAVADRTGRSFRFDFDSMLVTANNGFAADLLARPQHFVS